MDEDGHSFGRMTKLEALFGASTPLSKRLLGTVDPIVLAGLLYFGAGLGAAMILGTRLAFTNRGVVRCTPGVSWKQAVALAGAVLAGGVAVAVFGEAIGRRVWIAIGFITSAGCVLAWRPEEPWGLSLGVLGIVLACAGEKGY